MAWRLTLNHPARLVVVAFLIAVVVGTVLLLVPVAWRGPGGASLDVALFTATSAVCVTGLAVVDTGTSWTWFGQLTIALLAQIGGIGIMTGASLVVLAILRRVGLTARVLTQAEVGAVPAGEVRRVLRAVTVFSFAIEAVVFGALTVRYVLHYDERLRSAAGRAAFDAIMAFNNAGFSLNRDSFVPYVGDWYVCLPIMFAVVAGGLGFPVLIELVRRVGPRRWSLHTRLTLLVSLVLLVAGTVAVLVLESSNPATLGPLSVPEKGLAAAFQSVSSRTAGFNSVDLGAMGADTWAVLDVLMFIGSGSASTGGGIKVTTIAVLVLATFAELRGRRDVTFARRRIPAVTVRQALTVTALGALAVTVATALLMGFDEVAFDQSLFETSSAFATTGMSTGITGDLSLPSQWVLIVLMFLGRVGPITLGAALVLRRRHTGRDRYDFPEERPLVG